MAWRSPSRFPVLAAALLAATALAPAPAVAQAAAPALLGTVVSPSDRQNSPGRPIGFAAQPAAGGTLVVVLDGEGRPRAPAPAGVAEALATAGVDGRGGRSEMLGAVGGFNRVLALVLPEGEDLAQQASQLGTRAASELVDMAGPISILAEGLPAAAVDSLALGFTLGDFRFDRLKSAPPARASQPVTIVTSDPAAAQRWQADGRHLADGLRLARELVTEPANIIYPESFVERVRAELRGLPNVSIEVLDEPAMRRLGMGSLLSVGQGSARPSRLMIVHYRGAGGQPLALVGKGITFDSGGISIKPAAGMWRMKYDMAGAAMTAGAVVAAARRRAPVNLVAAMALSENMPDANATRPGDVVRTMNGQTIEVINTDAEGRMVLVDANQYVAGRYNPQAIVNIATLTGAIVTALGDRYAGLFARDEALAERIQQAARESGDAVWRMPLHPRHAEIMRSEIADLRNAAEGAAPGSSLAAQFIQLLTPQPVPWAHLDIAGVTWRQDPLPGEPRGATGFGFRLFDRLIRQYEAAGGRR